MKPTPLTAVIITLVFVGAACQNKVSTTNQATTNQTTTNTYTSNQNTNTAAVTASWSFNGSDWQAYGVPPTCPTPLSVSTPVDLSLASAILYPGQTRGGDYKPHGGFRFDGRQNNQVVVRAPLDAVVYNASRYIEQGETQYLITFINPCGIAYRFDHLLTLSPSMQAIADTLPAAQVDNSATTMITSGAAVKAGDTVATAVGFKNNANVSLDFGLYDLRTKNAASGNATYVSSHGAEYAQHGLCWLDHLTGADAATVKSLPGGDQTSGKTSDYCQ